MSYTVLARKYRPQTFADLSGQEHVARTLGNAIAQDRVAHAFLFTGVRGVGKTSTARILAKALNCASGPTMTPCGTCDACREITLGTDLDVLEIDGASNNSVDDVRRLQETIPFRPARDRFKIVIVDEVHMLSTGAFNAFLKTLEEPPPHVKFIFATTEAHKVPVTIRSRCQRYDFRLIPQAVLSERVKQILAAEAITADERAISIVAREAAGSMRDALTLLDQIVAFSGASLVGDEVARVLGIADREALHATATALLDGDGASVLREIDRLAERGLDLLHFSRALVELLRDLVVLRVSGPSTPLVALVEEERERALALAKRVEPAELQRAFHGASLLVEDVARAPMPRMALEMGLVRLASRPPLRPLAELVARLEAIEAKLGATRGPSAFGRGATRESSRRASPGGAMGPASDEPAPALRGEPTRSTRAVAPSPTIDAAPRERASAAPPPEPDELGPDEERESAPSPAPGEPPPALTPGEDGALSAWEIIVTRLVETRPALGAMLKHGTPRRVDAERLVIEYLRDSFYGKQIESMAGIAAIADTAERVLGARPEVEIAFGASPRGATIAALEDARVRERLEATRKRALHHPQVQDALRIFGIPIEAAEVRVLDEEEA